jgi:chitinase
VDAYYVGYESGLLPIDELDFSTLTHLEVGRITPKADGGLMTNFDINDVDGPILAKALAQRAHAAGRKAILMLGGAGEHAGVVGAAANANRAGFVANLLATLDAYGFDGIDVDWEPIDAADRPNLLALLRDLRAARPGMLLTIPVGWANTNFPGEIDSYYADIAAEVDRLNLMTYDMAGNYGGWDSWHHSPLFGDSPSHPASADSSVKIFAAAGVPKAKLGIGMGFYGSCWRGVTGPGVPLTGLNATLVASDGGMSYANIAASYLPNATRIFDQNAKVPYLSASPGAGPNACNFISYEDAESIAAKGAYVLAQGLGGAIIWTIGQGHSATAPAGSRDPLMQAVKAAFLK